MPETQLLSLSSDYARIGIDEVYDIAHGFGVSFASAAYRLLDLVRYNYWRGPRILVSRLDWFLNLFPSSPFEGSPAIGSARVGASRGNQRIESKFAKAFTRLLDLEESKAPDGRPIFVEFCGTPRAGKDSTIDIVREYLEDVLGVRVGIIDEDVKDWWSKDPRSIYRSCLSVMSTLHTARIENPGDCDVILANRNAVDRIAFLGHLMRDAEPTTAKLARAHITLLQMYAQRLVDLVVMLIISPDEAIERESLKGGTRSTVERIAGIKGYRSALREPRNILNVETLRSLNEQYQMVSGELGRDLKAIWVCDGSVAGDMSLIEKSISVIDIIGETLRDNSGMSETVRSRVMSQECKLKAE